MRTVLAACVAAVLLLASHPSAADAHPLHTTLTEITVDGQRRVLHLMIRVFAEDFARAASGTARPGTLAQPEVASDAYLRRTFTLTEAGRTLPLRPCPAKRTGDLLWLCFEAPAPANVTLLRLHNALLCDLFDDQVNIVRTTVAGAPHSVLFTRGDPTKPLL